MIKVENLNKHYDDVHALKDVSIHVKKGAIYGLVGPNGSGKTTLLKHISGVYKQDDGNVLVMGEELYNNDNIKEKMIFISDDVYYFPQYTIKQMAKFYKMVYPNWDDERYEKIKKVFEIPETKKMNQLSKGMKKQVAFWLAISAKPEIMILDEPVDGLDPIARKKVWGLLMQDIDKREMTILVSSHNLRELEDVCDYVGVMKKGKVLLEKNLEDMKSLVKKIQIAFNEEVNLDEIKVLYKEKVGSVYTLIVEGEEEELKKKFSKFNPVIFNILPLTLEEIFIYEVGDENNELKNVFI